MYTKVMYSTNNLWDTLKGQFPGFMLCAVIAAAASFVSSNSGGPKFLYALLIGIAFNFLADNAKCIPGIEISAKKLVRIGVALLGVRIAVSDVSDLGAAGVGALIGGVLLTISFGLIFARLLKLPSTLGLLSGGATGICGISAAMAISSTLPQNSDNENYTLLTAIGIATFSTVAMVTYPIIVSMLGLTTPEAGLFLGGAIHDVAQVVGAGFTISSEVGDAATLAKMFRVAMLMPVIVFLVFFFRDARKKSAGEEGKKQPLIPGFLLVFVGLVAINSMGLLSEQVIAASSGISKWCLVISIAGLGVKTSFEKLFKLGWRPIVLFLGNTIFIAGYMLLIIYLSRISGS